MTCRVRRATAADGLTLEEIERTCFQHDVWKKTDFLRYQCSVAEWEGRLVGFIVTLDVFSGKGGELCEREILNLAVLPDYRRLGIGRYLLEHELRRPGLYWLEVRESNVAARSLYRSLGFTEVGVRTKYYASPAENAIVMRIER